MKAAELLANLRRRVPEFTADDLFLDLPYVVFGEFAEFVIGRLGRFGADDPVVKRSFDFVNTIFFDGDPEMVNVVETALFERLADDSELARTARSLVETSARESFDRVAAWAGSKDVRRQ